MTEPNVVRGAAPTVPSLFARLAGVLLAPRETFTRLVAAPRAFDAILAAAAVWAACIGVFTATEIGRQALVDWEVLTLESWGRPVSNALYERLLATAGMAPVFSAAAAAVLVVLSTLAATVLARFAFHVVAGARASFRQVLAVVAHANAVVIVEHLVVTPLNYARESMANLAHMGIFVPVDDGSVIGTFLGALNLFRIWWLVVLSIGLAVLYRRPTRPILLGMLVAYGVLGLVVAAFKAVVGIA